MPKWKRSSVVKIPYFTLFEYKQLMDKFEFPGGEVGLEIEDLGKKMRNLKPQMTLSELMALYDLGGVIDVSNLRERISAFWRGGKIAKNAHTVFESHQKRINDSYIGEWLNDVIDYRAKKNDKLPEGYTFARWIKNPDFKQENLKGEKSVDLPVILPPEGYAIPSNCGIKDSETGAPIKTIQDRQEALDMLKEKGFKHPDKNLVYFKRPEEKQVSGVFVIYNQVDGLIINTIFTPYERLLKIGSRYFKRTSK